MRTVSIFQSTTTWKHCTNYKIFSSGGGKKTDWYLVQPACEIDDDFSGSVIVNDLKLTNVTCGVKQRH